MQRREVSRHASPPLVPRRAFLADVGMGMTGLVLGDMLWRDRVARASEASAWSPPTGQPHFRPRAKSVIWIFLVGGMSHLESFDPKPALERIRRQGNRRDAAQGRADRQLHRREPAGRCAQRRQRPYPPQAVSDASRVSEARPKRPGSERLVSAARLVRRRPGRGPLGVDHRQQSRGPTAIPHRPARARRAVSHDRLLDPLRPGLDQRQPAEVRRAGHADRRLLRRHRRSRGQLPGARAQRRATGGRSQESRSPLPLPGATSIGRNSRPSLRCSTS